MGCDDVLNVTLREVNGLYILQTCLAWESVRALAAQDGEEDEEKVGKQAALWHFCLVHLGADAVRRLSMEDNVIRRLPIMPCCMCMGCIYGKIVHKPFPSLPLSIRTT